MTLAFREITFHERKRYAFAAKSVNELNLPANRSDFNRNLFRNLPLILMHQSSITDRSVSCTPMHCIILSHFSSSHSHSLLNTHFIHAFTNTTEGCACSHHIRTNSNKTKHELSLAHTSQGKLVVIRTNYENTETNRPFFSLTHARNESLYYYLNNADSVHHTIVCLKCSGISDTT